MANVNALKERLGYEAFQFSYLKDVDDSSKRAIDPNTKEPTKWLRHWDNDNRIAVVMHEDTALQLKANPEMTTLELKNGGTKQGAKGDYQLYTMFSYTTPDFEF